jgi:hypothetical protein
MSDWTDGQIEYLKTTIERLEKALCSVVLHTWEVGEGCMCLLEAQTTKKKRKTTALIDVINAKTTIFGRAVTWDDSGRVRWEIARYKPADILSLTTGKFSVKGIDYPVNMHSLSYDCFRKSTVCAFCGLEATIMILEKNPSAKIAHFKLYGMRDGKETMFTKDHIIPKSKGGTDEISNLQTMCLPCNNAKGDKVFPAKQEHRVIWPPKPVQLAECLKHEEANALRV